jgi:foldase protein PrsA
MSCYAAQLMALTIVTTLMTGSVTTSPAVGGSDDQIERSGRQNVVQIVASVNGDSITEDDLYARMTRQYGQKALDNLIDARLVSQSGKALGIVVSDAELAAMVATIKQRYDGKEQFATALKSHGQTLAQLERDLVFDETLRRILIRDVAVDDTSLQRFFAKNRGTFAHREIHHRHILSRTVQEADDIKAQLDAGVDFAALAKERSNDANSFQKGGDMGWWPLDRTPDAYRQVVLGLGTGEISAPFRSYLGWEVAQVLEIKGTVEFDTVKDRVKNAYLRAVIEQRRDPWLAEQHQKASIETSLFDAAGDPLLAVPVVATVNGEAITRGELYEAMKVHYGARMLGRMIDEELVAQSAAIAGVTVSEAEVEAYIDRIKRRLGEKGVAETDRATLAQLKADKVTEVLVRKILAQDVTVDDPALRQFFDQHLSQFDWRVVHSRHILCKTEAEARAIKALLDGGADFATLAKERSIDANTYAKGGDLGWTGRGQTPVEYEHVVFAFKEGEISDPIRSFLGWHIAQVLEIKDTPDFDTMKAEIKDAYLEDQIKSKYHSWFAEQRRRATITNTLQSPGATGEP